MKMKKFIPYLLLTLSTSVLSGALLNIKTPITKSASAIHIDEQIYVAIDESTVYLATEPTTRMTQCGYLDLVTIPLNSTCSFLLDLPNVNPYSIETIIVEDAIVLPTADHLFSNLCSLKEIVNFNYLDATYIRRMEYMFAYCESLTTVDFTGFNTSNCVSFRSMFADSGVTSLDLTSLDTSSISDFKCMFDHTSSLVDLDISTFVTTSAEEMSYMFSHCGVEELDLSNFDTSSVTKMVDMFSDMPNLTTLNVSSFDTSSVDDISGMFRGLDALKDLDISNFNLGNLDSATGVFDFSSIEGIHTPINIPTGITIEFNNGYEETIYYDSSFTTTYSEIPHSTSSVYLVSNDVKDDVETFTRQFVTSMSNGCDPNGNTDKDELGEAWSTAAILYGFVFDNRPTCKYILQNCDASTQMESAQEFAELYDYIYEKYGEYFKEENYAQDFAHRFSSSGTSSNKLSSINSTNQIIVEVVMVSLITSFVAVMVIVTKKKKQIGVNND